MVSQKIEAPAEPAQETPSQEPSSEDAPAQEAPPSGDEEKA